MHLTNGEVLAADLLVLSTGTVPSTQLAEAAGIDVDRGVLVDADLTTSDPHVHAIGDCAQPPGGASGLVAQGWEQARRLADLLTGRDPETVTTGVGDVVKPKTHGVDIVTMGVCGSGRADEPGLRVVQLSDPSAGRHLEIVVRDGLLLGATTVGAGRVGTDLITTYTRRTPLPADPAHLLLPAVAPAATTTRRDSPSLIPDRATICRCNGVTKGTSAPSSPPAQRRWSRWPRARGRRPAAAAAPTPCAGSSTGSAPTQAPHSPRPRLVRTGSHRGNTTKTEPKRGLPKLSAMPETTTPTTGPQQLVIVGGGMVARRLVDALRARDDAGRWAVTLLCEEPRAPYDRVALTSYFTGRHPEDLALGGQELWDDPLVTLRRGVRAESIDRDARTVTTSTGQVLPYDSLVLATGSYAAVPPVPGKDLRGAFVYRTIDDVADLREFVETRREELDRPVRGAVVGGGLLGLGRPVPCGRSRSRRRSWSSRRASCRCRSTREAAKASSGSSRVSASRCAPRPRRRRSSASAEPSPG